MIEVIQNLIHNVFSVWIAGSIEVYMSFAIGTMFLFAPAYMVFAGLAVFDIKLPKFMKSAFKYIVTANAVLALLPFLIPIGMVVGGYRLIAYLLNPQRRHRQLPEQAHEDEDDSDHH